MSIHVPRLVSLILECFSDDQIAEYYGNVRNKYIKVMGFDYDHVKFDEIGSDMKIESDSVRLLWRLHIFTYIHRRRR